MGAIQLSIEQYSSREPQKRDLHRIIRENYLSVFEEKESRGITFPFHIKREFERYLTCGILSHGFARFRCYHCKADKLVAYSCKRRTICPSCSGRRMSDTAKHLVERVIPVVPVRQWVLSMPYHHRYILSSNSLLLTASLGIYHRAVSSFYRMEAKKLGLKRPMTGAVTVIQRFGGALNLNVHFHSIFMDGVYYENEKGNLVFREIIPSSSDICKLVEKIKVRINRSFVRRGVGPKDDDYNQRDLLSALSTQNLLDGFKRPIKIGKYCDPPYEEFKGKRCAYDRGFSLHANVKILASHRSALERLCRYIARGALSQERIALGQSGRVIFKLKNPYRDGTTHLEFTPEQFIKRVITLIPPARKNMIRYYGVFGARHNKRGEVTSRASSIKKKTNKKAIYRTPWADLLKHVFKYEVNYCDRCGTKLTLIAPITSPNICSKIINHLGLDATVVTPQLPRGPPIIEGFLGPDDQFDFNQELNW
mgnify:FL=1